MTTRNSARNLQSLCGNESMSINTPKNGYENSNSPVCTQSVNRNDCSAKSPSHIRSELQRDFTLNMDRALKKKLNACNAEYKIYSECKSGNYVFVFSTAMYELYRLKSAEHFDTVKSDENANIKVVYKDCVDRSGATVELQMKIYKKSNNRLKYTINMYHTKCKLLVNGREAHLFNLEHAKISDYIMQSEDVAHLDRIYSNKIQEV